MPLRDSSGHRATNGQATPPMPEEIPNREREIAINPRHVIEVRSAGRRHPNGSDWLIQDISFAVRPGERIALVGSTGAGKSVLLRALALLDPLDAGAVTWAGAPILGDRVPIYRTHVLYLHQRPALFDGDVEANLTYPYMLRSHAARRFERERTLAHLAQLGRPPEFLSKPGRDLSGGESQIVALLRALQLDPAVLLLDEPTAALDGGAVTAVEQLLERWFVEGCGERTVVWVSHDPKQAERVADRRLLLSAGKLESDR